MPEYPEHGRPHLKSKTLPEALKDSGYQTAVIGKWHIHSWPHDLGFDYSLLPRVHHAYTGQLFTENGGPEFAAPGYSVCFEADAVDKYLSDRTSHDPFFLYYSISPPHCRIADIPEEFREMYDPDLIVLRENVRADLSIDGPERWLRIYRWDYRYYSHELPYTLDLPQPYGLRELIAEYYGATTWLNQAVGRLLTSLDENGLSENTIVVFLSDHGDNLGSHGLVQKGTPNTESVRVPLIVRYPEVVPKGNWVRSVSAGIVDIAPTLLDMVGTVCPDHMHGKTLVPWIMGDALPDDKTWTFFETAHGVGVQDCNEVYFTRRNPDTGVLAEPASWQTDLLTDPFEMSASSVGITLQTCRSLRFKPATHSGLNLPGIPT